MTEKSGRNRSTKGTWFGVVLALVTFALILAVLLQNFRATE